MGGFFGVASKTSCVSDLFYGTDYHSHLGTRRGGMAVIGKHGFVRHIHNIENAQFRSKFETDVLTMEGRTGIGVISDYEDQPLLIASHLGNYAIVTVGIINNAAQLAARAFGRRATHFAELGGGEINPTELVATLINEADTFEDGIRNAQERIDGSCSILLLTSRGIYAARDRFGRTPVICGRKKNRKAYAVTMETTAFPNLDFETVSYLGPGEVALITAEGVECKKKPLSKLRICSFLWIYYGYPSSHYEGINVEEVRYRCGAVLARNETEKIDIVAGIPDSGTSHAMGYANEAGLPFIRPFVKYTPTWPRSFMPQDQSVRKLVAAMKLIPIPELIAGQRMLFCEDSIVRGTQLGDIIRRLFLLGAKEVHMRPACPPLIFGCKFLNFSRSKTELELAARRAIHEIEGKDPRNLDAYTNPCSDKYCVMVEKIRRRLGLTTLRYQKLDDMIAAIGLPLSKLCTYCWTGHD